MRCRLSRWGLAKALNPEDHPIHAWFVRYRSSRWIRGLQLSTAKRLNRFNGALFSSTTNFHGHAETADAHDYIRVPKTCGAALKVCGRKMQSVLPPKPTAFGV